MDKPIVVIAFDGAVCQSSEHNGAGDIAPGFFLWAAKACKLFDLQLYAPRFVYTDIRDRAEEWLNNRIMAWYVNNKMTDTVNLFSVFSFIHVIPVKLHVAVGTRFIGVRGDWTDLDVQPDALENFTPWSMSRAKSRAVRDDGSLDRNYLRKRIEEQKKVHVNLLCATPPDAARSYLEGHIDSLNWILQELIP